MKQLLLAFALIAVSSAAGAVPVVLVAHTATGGGTSPVTFITDGSHVSGIATPSTVVWDWDGSTLTGTGLYTATASINGSPVTATILAHQVTDLTISTGGTAFGFASAASYSCVEGTFLSGVGVNGCGGYSLGANFIDESSTTYGPGLAVSQIIGGDDFQTGGPQTITTFNYGIDSIVGVNGLTPGDLVVLGNGIPPGSFFSERMTFQVVPIPAAIWLFGSALGMLGLIRRKTTARRLVS